MKTRARLWRLLFLSWNRAKCYKGRTGGHGKPTFVGTGIYRTPDTETGNNPNDGIQLHVVAVVKKKRSIQTQTRFDDFKVEVDEADFEVFLFTK